MKKQTKTRFRLLPIIIFLCAIIFSLKIESMWEATSSGEVKKISFISMQSAQAQKVDPIKNKMTAKSEEDKNDNISEEPPEPSTNAANLMGGETIDPDAEKFTQSEIDILQDLAQRRKDIEEKEKELDIKIAMMDAAQIQIDKKILKLQDLEKSIQDLVTAYDNQEKTQMDSLVTIYSNMKPKDAARIFNDLDMEILIKVFSQMKESKAATILASMDGAKANALTLELANKNRPDFIKKASN